MKIKTFIFKTKDKIIHFQPLELVKRTRARKKTDKVTRKTAIHRSKVVAETRTVVSGGAAGTQFKDELHTMGRLEREALLKEALGKEFKITIPRGDILAMKADLGKTWYKVRKLRRLEKHEQKIIKNPKDFPKTLDISNSNCFEFVSKFANCLNTLNLFRKL